MLWYSKKYSHRGGSFEHPKHTIKLLDKKINRILLSEYVILNILFLFTHSYLQKDTHIQLMLNSFCTVSTVPFSGRAVAQW